MDRSREVAEHAPDEISAHLDTLRAELHLVARARGQGRIAQTWKAEGLDASRYLPLPLAPILDPMLVAGGFAVGWYMTPPRLFVPPHLFRPGRRFLMGELVYCAKHLVRRTPEDEHRHIATMSALAARALATAPFALGVDLIAAVPSSRGSNTLPQRVAELLARSTGQLLTPEAAIRFTRPTTQSKMARDYWSALDRMHGAMDAHPATFAGRSVLLVDDVCEYGVTLAETARACREAGARIVFVLALALAKTLAHQRHPDLPPETGSDRAFPRRAMPPPAPGWFGDATGGFPDDMTEVPIP